LVSVIDSPSAIGSPPEVAVVDTLAATSTRVFPSGRPRCPARRLDLAGARDLKVARSGRASGGPPPSLQLVARELGETTLFQAGAAFESATPWHEQRPPV